MNKSFKTIILFIIGSLSMKQLLMAQNPLHIPLVKASFITGDDEAYNTTEYDDAKWDVHTLGEVWQTQGYPKYHGFAWYRIHVTIPSSLRKEAIWKDSLRVFLAHVNDVDETFLNGKKIGHTGSFPHESGGYLSKWPAIRTYHIAADDSAIKWDQDNVIAIRVYDGGGSGGIFMGQPFIDMVEKINGIKLDGDDIYFSPSGQSKIKFSVSNTYNTAVSGQFSYTVYDAEQMKLVSNLKMKISLGPLSGKVITIIVPHRQAIELKTTFIESKSGYSTGFNKTVPYLLTPPVAEAPAINGASVLGVRPGHDFLYKIPATGKGPLRYTVTGLPAGITLDSTTGVLSGIFTIKEDHKLKLFVQTAKGSASKNFTVRVGTELALTPPMGWNSWNCWGISVSQEKVKSSAQSLIDKGLINHGWNYINIDDGWEAASRSVDGKITPNHKFPDMKELGNYLHNKGLKFGIYSSPGTHTCGGYLGSFQHELSDAETYAEWGIDYLKYDLCSYLDSMRDRASLQEHQLPFEVMSKALGQQKRDIIYSICQYGMQDVWKWGKDLTGNLWRTTEDIDDTWESLYNIGFSQDSLYPFAKPGGWNDPDMLIVGMVGWGENLHPSRLTVDEQYTHISLWSMLSAPLLIGCDISKLDKFTLNLLNNDEVIAIDQDPLGQQAKKVLNKDSIRVYIKNLADGSKAVAIFNMGNGYKKCAISFSDIGLNGLYQVRDVWRRKNIGTRKNIEKTIAPHGVFLFTVNDI